MENKWYKVVVNQKLNKGETYTIEITGKGIKAERPLYLYTSSNMGKIYQSAKLNGVTQKNFHVRTRVWTTQIDVSAVVLTVAITLALIILILIPLKIPENGIEIHMGIIYRQSMGRILYGRKSIL